ncbi:lysophosphatidylcholine acyltransferase 2-like isoform X2 [Corticium candelabrum]|uniref:lysophosphatidylcholine acyltransferase 2-like isoform X2 n=1 Tax=Corticium candelabrum TaxID=121492 RepID=UPI002E25D40B|nr:lysophosphatidylcholine acyltransferase 2-like isoform X2 [Corticium candelabrum]
MSTSTAKAIGKKKRPILRAASFKEASINPFEYDYSTLKFSKWQIAKIVLNTVLLLPIRVVLSLFFLLLTWLISLLILVGLKDGLQICCGWRRFLSRILVRLCRYALVAFGFWWINVKGKRASREEAPVIIAPLHSSYIDFLVAGIVSDFVPCGVHRRENGNIPLIGTLVKATQQILVDRDITGLNDEAVKSITDRARDNRWPHIFIFPEGVCTNRKALVTFRRGAFVAGCPVQPVLFHYRNKMDTTTWTWTGLSAHFSFYLTLCQFANYLEIEYCPVYTPSNQEKEDPILYANNVRNVLAKKLNLPTSDHTFEDIRLMTSGTRHSLPFNAGIVEFVKLKDRLHMDLNDMKRHLSQFAEIDENKDGYVDIEEFCQYLSLPVSSQLRDVFSLYDRNGDGRISFREYLISVALICDPANTDETLRFAFQTVDINGDGFVDRDELKLILCAAFDGIKDEHVDEIFREADKDGEGKLSYDEFAQCCSKRPEYAVLFKVRDFR